MRPTSPKKAYCRNCDGDRNCDIQGFFRDDHSEGGYWWREDWFILQCRGCDEVFCQKVQINSEEYDYVEDEHTGEWLPVADEKISYWPAKLKRKRPDWLGSYGIEVKGVDSDLDRPILQVHVALDNDLDLLATIGVRTAFEVAASMLGVDASKSFAEKLNELVALEKILERDKDHLHLLIKAGNASAHRGWTPTTGELNAIVDLFEHFIEEAFVAPARRRVMAENASRLKNRVPPRKKRSSSGDDAELQ